MSDESNIPAELPFPPQAVGNAEAVELLRAWVVDGGLSVSLRAKVFADIDSWGLLLVDILRHVARAYESEGEGDFETNAAKILDMFQAEIGHPTDMGTTQKPRPQ
ncbi:MAG TPA: DUF5076 domain-containing protein [Hyphomicrobiales bacterium]|nr:DUF5076 domain-containing protein [Hyphomicrobiales bacterium]